MQLFSVFYVINVLLRGDLGGFKELYMRYNIQHNTILYYADYLSLRDISIPVTDNCKYYFIHGIPINSAYIVDK